MSLTSKSNAAAETAASPEEAEASGGTLNQLIRGMKRGHSDAFASPPTSCVPTTEHIMSPEQQKTINKAKSGGHSPPKHMVDGKLVVADDEDIKKRMRADGFGAHIDKETEAEIILRCMYGRKFFKEDKERRVQELKLMIDPKQEKIHERAKRFVRLDGDITNPDSSDKAIPAHSDKNNSASSKEEPKHSVDRMAWKSIADHYGTEEPENGLGWNAFAHFGSKFIQRVQRSGNCFLHAPAVVQSYLIKGEKRIQVIDICKYARHSFNSEKVSRYIVGDSGGNACLEFLAMLDKERVVMSKYDDVEETSNCTCNCPNYMFHMLRTCGPALVHCFVVDENFKTATAKRVNGHELELPCFTGRVKNDSFAEKHAMALVGMRKVGDTWRFLLQNWWPDLQLVEMTGEYLKSSEARLVFAIQDQNRIPKEFARCDESYAEAEVPGMDSATSSCLER